MSVRGLGIAEIEDVVELKYGILAPRCLRVGGWEGGFTNFERP